MGGSNPNWPFHLDSLGKEKLEVELHCKDWCIDADYWGEVKILAQNVTSTPIKVGQQTRIAQQLLLPTVEAKTREITSCSTGEAGFGFTGKKNDAVRGFQK